MSSHEVSAAHSTRTIAHSIYVAIYMYIIIGESLSEPHLVESMAVPSIYIMVCPTAIIRPMFHKL